jgi:pSer/pThr/pTyr-binding forkhead associated (FHA) protein
MAAMATLIVVEGPARGSQFALAEHRLVLIGRDDECTFQIIDDQISRRHVQVKRRDDADGHVAIDFGSANGVFVNDRRIEQETPLGDGDTVRLGATTMVYTVTDSPDAQSIEDLLRKRGEHRRSTLIDG